MSNFLQIKSIRRAAPLRNAARIISIMILALLWPARGEAQVTDLDVSSINAATTLSYKLKSEPDTYAWYYKIGEGSETEFSGKLTGTNENCPLITIESKKEVTASDYAGCATLQLEEVTLTATGETNLINTYGTNPICIQTTGVSPSTLKYDGTTEYTSVILDRGGNGFTGGGPLILDAEKAELNIVATKVQSYGIYLFTTNISIKTILKGKINIEAWRAIHIGNSSNLSATPTAEIRCASYEYLYTDVDERIKTPFLQWKFDEAPASGQPLEIRDASGNPLASPITFTTNGKAKSFAINVTEGTPYTLWLDGKKQKDSNGATSFTATESKYYEFTGITEFLAANWSEYAQTAQVGPTGTDVTVAIAVDDTTYTVHTPAGLAWIAWVTNSGKNNTAEADKYYPATAGFEGCTVTLANNISLTTPTTGVASSGFDASWPTIGKGTGNSFKGTFDGGSHTVSGLSLTIPNDRPNNGLFGYIDGANIKNLRVEGNIGGESSIGNNISVGGIVGMADKSNIIACSNAVVISVKVTINEGGSDLNIGGIVGQVGSGCNIHSCWNEATLSGESSKVLYIGGIVGINNAPIFNCYSSGDVSGKGNSTSECASGGIAGCIRTGLYNCYATGSVSATATNSGIASAGGIAGYIHTTGSIGSCLALNAGNKISAISNNGGSSNKGRIVGRKGEGSFISISNNYASTKIMLSDDGTNFTAPTTEIGGGKINGADVYLDDVADAIKTWAGSENTKAFTAIDTDEATGMLPQLKTIDGYGTNGLPSTYGNSTMAHQPSFTTSDYLALPTALELPARGSIITLSCTDDKWRYKKDDGASTRFDGRVKMEQSVNSSGTSFVVETVTGTPTLTFENVELSEGQSRSPLTINDGCTLTLNTTGDKPFTIKSNGSSPVIVNKGTLTLMGTGLWIESFGGDEHYCLDNSGTFNVSPETSVTFDSYYPTINNNSTLGNAWIEWRFNNDPGKIVFAAIDDTNQSPGAQTVKRANIATPVTPGKTYRLWKVTDDSPGEVRTRQTGKKDGKTVALFPAPAANEVAVYTDVKDVEEVTIANSQNFSTAACSEKNVTVGTGGVLTIDAADAQVINLKLEKDGQVITTNALKVDETFSTTRSLDNEWIAFGSPVAMKASVKKEDNDSLLYVGTGYTDVAPSKQVWENVSGIPDTGTKTADLAADHPYLLAADAPSTKVTFTATAGTAPLEIPQTATVAPGSALADGVFLFRTNPNLSNLTLSNIYVLNAEGDRFELHPGDYDVKPFEAYITANEETCSRVRSLKIGDNIATGIDRPLTADTRIWGTRGTLHISADAPADVLIVTPAGRTLRSLKASAGETTLALPSGIYFVRCNGITYKISL